MGFFTEDEKPTRSHPENAGERIAEFSICVRWPSSSLLLSKDVRPAARRCCSHGRACGRNSVCMLAPRLGGCVVKACTMHSTFDLQPALQNAPLVMMQLSRLASVTWLLPFCLNTQENYAEAAGKRHHATSHKRPPSAVNNRAARLSD